VIDHEYGQFTGRGEIDMAEGYGREVEMWDGFGC
jgi:hypothetical protein